MAISGNISPIFKDFTSKTNKAKKENNLPEKPVQKTSMAKEIAGNVAGIAVLGSAIKLSKPVGRFIFKFSKDDFQLGIKLEDVVKEANLMINKHALKEKGFVFEIVPKNLASDISESDKILYLAERKFARGGGVYTAKGSLVLGTSVKIKKNAAVTIEERASSILHEIGHAVQFNNSKIGRLLYKCRIDRQINIMGKPVALFLIIPSTILGLAMNHKKKDSDNKNENSGNKMLGFIKNHAGTITFATFLPMLLDEGFATKHALDHLKSSSSTMIAPLRKKLGFAYLTYLSMAAFMTLGVKGGIALKDKIVNHQSQATEK